MIFVDDRIGSADLVEPLRAMGLPVEEVRLHAGDVAFWGKGPDGSALAIGIELKRLGDLVSSIRTGRLSGGQLPKLLGSRGAFDYCWLVVEGHWRTNSAGQIVVPYYSRKKKQRTWAPLQGGLMASEMEKRVMTLELCGGLHVRHTNTAQDTHQFIVNLYHWWSDKDMDRHTSHLTPHTVHAFLPVSPFRTTVQTFPGIGPRTSLAVERRFHGSLVDAVSAPIEVWASIETVGDKGTTRKLGRAVATQIHTFCRTVMRGPV